MSNETISIYKRLVQRQGKHFHPAEYTEKYDGAFEEISFMTESLDEPIAEITATEEDNGYKKFLLTTVGVSGTASVAPKESL